MARIEKFVTRPADAKDAVNILRLLEQQYPKTVAANISPFNAAAIGAYISATIANPLSYKIVCEKNGRLLGSLAMAPIKLPWFGEKIILTECWFPVLEKYVDKGVPDALLGAAEAVLDHVAAFGLFGTSLFTTPGIDGFIADTESIKAGRGTFVRLPNAKVTKQ